MAGAIRKNGGLIPLMSARNQQVSFYIKKIKYDVKSPCESYLLIRKG